MKFEEWNGFKCGDWQNEINVRDFIQHNYTPYEGNSDFLEKLLQKQKSYGIKYWIYIKRNMMHLVVY